MNALPQSDSRCFDAAATEATALCERHRSRLVGFCTAQMGSREEAEDAVQDTFIYALRALRRGIVPECETAWLFTIARNVCSSRRRNGSRRSRLVVTRDLDALQDVIPGRERQRDELFGLPEALAAIPETQRQAILLREWQGLTYAEIAETLDLSKSAVETLLFRARRSLARALEHAGRTAVRVLNVSPVLGFVRSLLEGGAAKVVAGTLAVVAAGTIGGRDRARHEAGDERHDQQARVGGAGVADGLQVQGQEHDGAEHGEAEKELEACRHAEDRVAPQPQRDQGLGHPPLDDRLLTLSRQR